MRNTPFNEKNKNSSTDWPEFASFLHFAVSAIVFGVIFALNSAIAQDGQDAPIGPAGLLMVAVTIYMVGLHFRERENYKRYSASVLELSNKIEELEDSHRVERYKSREQASYAIRSRVRYAREVRNTFFPNKNKRVGDHVSNPEAIDIFWEWLGGPAGQLWQDVVGPEEFFDERYNVQSRSRVLGEKTHTISVLKHGTTCPNFTLLTYADGTEEVFWGWISDSHAKKGSAVPYVFSSTEIEVVGFYRELFEILSSKKTWGDEIRRNYSSRAALPIASPNLIFDKVGCWMNVAYNLSEITSFGLYWISVSTNSNGKRGLILQGYTVSRDLNVIDIVNHSGAEISHYENKMFIEYGITETSGRDGFCFYEFRTNGAMSGFYTDEDSDQKNFITGTKVEMSADQIPELKMGDSLPEIAVQGFRGLKEKLVKENHMQSTLFADINALAIDCTNDDAKDD